MRINSLMVNNIASLKGKHHLNFDEILIEDKIFAITGDTGAGKSTLLNAISLALYGQNYKTNINQNDYVTLGEAEAQIEVKFSIHGLRYVAKWSSRLKKSSGEYLKNPKNIRELYLLEDEKLIPLPYLPEKILNLSFDQFCKTTILNQGQFAKFLTSSFRERKEIIEKLYQGEILEKLSPTIRVQLKEIQHQLEVNLSNINGLNDKLDTPLEELKNNYQHLSNDKEKFQAPVAVISEIDKNFHEYQNIYLQQTKNIDRRESIRNDVIEITKVLNTQKKLHFEQEKNLKDARTNFQKELPKLQHCEKEFHKLINIKEKLNLLNNQKSKLLIQLQHQKNQLSTLNLEIEKDESSIASKNEALTYLESSENLEDISKALEQFKMIHNQIDKDRSHLQSLDTLLSDYHKQGDELNKTIEELDKLLDANAIEESRKKLSQLSEKHLLLQDRYLQLKQLENKRIQWLQKIDDLNSTFKIQNVQISDLEDKIHACQKQEKLYENSIELHRLQEAIAICQHESIKQSQCIICQSTEISNILKSDLQSTKESLEYQDLKSSLNELKERIYVYEKKLHEHQVQLKTIHSQQNEILNDYNIEIVKIAKVHEIMLQKDLSIDLNYFIQTSQDQVSEIALELDETKKSLHKLEDGKIERIKVIEARDEFRKKYKSIKLQWNEVDQKIQKSIIKKTEYQSNLNSLIQRLTDFSVNSLEILTQDLTIAQQILTLSRVLTQKKENYTQLSKFIQEGEADLSGQEKEIQHYKKVTQEIQKYLVQEIGDNNPTELINQEREKIENQLKAFDQGQGQLKTTEIQMADLESRLQSSIDQIYQSELLLQQLWPKIQNAAYQLHTTSTELKLTEEHSEQNIRGFYLQLASAQRCDETAMLEYLIANNQQHLLCFKTRLEEIQQSITRFKTLIEEKEKNNQKIQRLQDQINQLHLIKNRKESLYELVGKDEFRNFVLALIEKDLIYQTNYELKSLCEGRYQLMHEQNGKTSPDFYILDKLKEGMTRKVSTLSGGETFMVSLAMALALAEMTRGQSEVDSFFIDEGFGTLDEDSLEDILDMLHHLQTRGKQIGIISHVKSLTKRISTNINLTKGRHGSSSIEIIYN